MGNVTSVSKKFKNFSFFDENWTEKHFWFEPPQQAAQLKGFPSISAEMLAFQSLLYRQNSKIYPLPSKESESWIFYR